MGEKKLIPRRPTIKTRVGTRTKDGPGPSQSQADHYSQNTSVFLALLFESRGRSPPKEGMRGGREGEGVCQGNNQESDYPPDHSTRCPRPLTTYKEHSNGKREHKKAPLLWCRPPFFPLRLKMRSPASRIKNRDPEHVLLLQESSEDATASTAAVPKQGNLGGGVFSISGVEPVSSRVACSWHRGCVECGRRGLKDFSFGFTFFAFCTSLE